MPESEHQTTLGEINEPGPEAGRTDEDKSVAEIARERAAEEARHAKEAAAQAAKDSAEQMHDAADAFDPESFARQIAERIADDLGQAARSVRAADLNGVADDVSDFARRQPALFYGGAALVGFAAARLLKASERAEHDSAKPHEPADPWGAA